MENICKDNLQDKLRAAVHLPGKGCYELSVVVSDGAPFEECELADMNFVRAEPGKEYRVKFIVHRDASGEFPYSLVICALAVDGTPIDNGIMLDIKNGRNEVTFSAAPVVPLHVDLSTEPDVVPSTESTALPPVVVDLRFPDQEEVSGGKQVKIEKKRRSGRGAAYKPDADTMVVDLMQDEEEKVVKVKVEKKGKGKRKGGNKKKRAVGVGLGGSGAFKKARGAGDAGDAGGAGGVGGVGGADNNATGDVLANKD